MWQHLRFTDVMKHQFTLLCKNTFDYSCIVVVYPSMLLLSKSAYSNDNIYIFYWTNPVKILSTFFFCFCTSLSILHSQSQSSIGVGHQPLSLFQNADTVHVFCNGIDKNFDGICQLDSGDIPATWWQIDAYTKALKGISVMERGYFEFPFRNAITKQYMYCSRANKIEQYDLSTRQLIDSSIVQLDNPSQKITAITAIQSSGKEIALMYSSKRIMYLQVNLHYLAWPIRQFFFYIYWNKPTTHISLSRITNINVCNFM